MPRKQKDKKVLERRQHPKKSAVAKQLKSAKSIAELKAILEQMLEMLQ